MLALARALQIGSAMLLVAFPFFRLAMVRAAAARSEEDDRAFAQRARAWMWGALIVEAVSGFAWFWFTAAQMADQSPWSGMAFSDLRMVTWQTNFGRLFAGRLVGGMLLAMALFFHDRRKKIGPRLRFLCDWLVLLLSSVMLVTLAWAGHAAAGIAHRALHLGTDILHLFIGAVWPMGLFPLACYLWPRGGERRGLFEASRMRTLERFSQTSFVAVLLLIVTGCINGWLMIGAWNLLVTTLYGRLLLGKVMVVLLMMGLGAYNRLVLLPRLRLRPNTHRLLSRTIVTEMVLALVVVLIVGLMGMTSPPGP